MTRPPPPDPTPAYPRQHTAADPSHVVTEKEVPNEQKALPSQKGPALALAFGGAGVALVAVVLEWMRLDLVALVLAILAVVMTGIATVMAINDVRTGRGAPILCLIVSIIVLVVVLADVFDVPEEIEERAPELRAPAAGTAEDRDVPADPAEIVETPPPQE